MDAPLTPSPRGDRTTRRHVLKLGGAAAASAVLAGCSSMLPGGGGSPAPDGYAPWLVAPTALDTDSYPFLRIDVEGVVAASDALDAETYGGVADAFEDNVLGIAFSDLEAYLTGRDYAVVRAAYDERDVLDRLDRTGYSRGDTYEGYTVMTADDGEDAYAVAGAAIVGGREARGDAATTVESVIDTAAGERERYQTADESMGTLLDALSGGTVVTGRTHERNRVTNVAEGTVLNRVAVGSTFAIGAETTDAEFTMVFPAEEDLYPNEVRLWGINTIQTGTGDRPAFDGMDLSTDGNVATIEASISTRKLTTDHLLIAL